jgi:hypothetical protein
MVYGRAHWQGTSICSPITWQPTAFLAFEANLLKTVFKEIQKPLV